MTRPALRLFAAGLAVAVLSAPAQARRQVSPEAFAAQLSDAYAVIASRMEPAVVSIDITERIRQVRRFRRGDAPRETEGVGSGFVVDPAGYVLTNNHVVEGAERIGVRLSDGSRLNATVVGVDPETDLALLQVDAGGSLPAVTLGDSDAIRPGNLVLALGSPFGFQNSVSAGIVSALGRDIPGGETFQRFIQTDASIHPGNSGGPLVNMAGEVIGVNTAVISSGRSSSGIGFALPSNTARDVFEQLLANGRVVRGSIGIRYSADPEEVAQAGGVPVIRVIPGGPAAEAGLQNGDVILSIAGQTVADGDTLLDIVAGLAVGDTLAVRVSRDGTELTFDVEIADRAEIYPDTAEALSFQGFR